MISILLHELLLHLQWHDVQFPTTNFAFAGYGVASNIANIDPSDFTISQYIPWVINNNNTTNFVTGPNRMNYKQESDQCRRRRC